jgi:hypothetical protein
MPTKEHLRELLQQNLMAIIDRVNTAMSGNDVAELEPVLARIGRGQQLPHWYDGLKKNHVLPNLDGKTIGSVIEMILVAVLETHTFKDLGIAELKINPARGVDLPDLDLGVKSPSENFCTSEPYFSAYERILGSEHDVLVLLTDYQIAKKSPPLKLKIIDHRYLKKTQIADRNLCRIAKVHREWLIQEDESRAQRFFRFLAYINQSDWRAKRLLSMVEHMKDDNKIRKIVATAEKDFTKTNKQRLKKDRLPIPIEDLEALQSVLRVTPVHVGIVDALDNWIIEIRKDSARSASPNEWKQFRESPLDGMIGTSLALQWRYSFKTLFGLGEDDERTPELT